MEDTLVIDTVEKLKVYADPLRQRILQAFCCNPSTTKQVAELLGEKPARLYHHIDLLEQHGFLEVVSTQQVRGTIEKSYQTLARKIIVDHALVGAIDEELGETPDIQNLVINTLQSCLVDARDHFAGSAAQMKGSRYPVSASQMTARFTPAQAQTFIDKVCQWIEEANEVKDEETTMNYAITIAAFPITATSITPSCCPDGGIQTEIGVEK